MRDERDMREKEFETLVSRAKTEMHGSESLATIFEDVAIHLEDESAKDTALQALRALSAHVKNLENAEIALAQSLNSAGIGFRVIAEATDTPTMTIKRKIDRYKEEREIL